MIYKDALNRLFIAYFLVLIEIISIVALNNTSRNDSYYLVASVFNFAIIFALPYIVRVNLIVDFQYLNFATFLVQGFGFFSYWYDIPKIFYNSAIHIISLMQILRLLIIRKGDADGLGENYYWDIVVYYFNFHYFKKMFKKENI